MAKYIVVKHIELRWEVEAESHEQAKTIVDDMGESTGNYTEKTRVTIAYQDPYTAISKTFLGMGNKPQGGKS